MTDTGKAAGPTGVSTGYYGPVLILMMVYTLGFIDRQVVNILAESIKRDLALSDTQLGLLTGLAFTLLYALAGLPIARLAERGDRPLIIAASLATWSAFTALCGTAKSFSSLLLFRAGVGLGEGGCVPAAHSLITESVPVDKRASAFAVFNMAVPIGTLIGLGLGGLLADHLGWRSVFAILGIPGLVLALVLRRLLPEPRKRVAAVASHGARRDWSQVRALIAKPTYRYAVAGGTMKAFITYGQAPFIASFIFRNHADQLNGLSADLHITPSGFVGVALGLTAGAVGLLGAWLGGVLADRFSTRSKRIYLLLPAVAALLIIPFNLLVFSASNLIAVLCLLAGPVLLNALWLGPVGATIQSVSPPNARATASALNLLIVNVFGLGLGPLLVGAMSDAFSVDAGSAVGVARSLMVSSLFGVVTAYLFFRGSRTIDKDAGTVANAANVTS